MLIQLVALVVALAAIHLTYLYYRRTSFTKRELYFWIFIWFAFIVVTLFPELLRPFAVYLGLTRPLDLLMISAFIILFALTFHNYVMMRQQRAKLERLIRELALNELKKK